MIFPEFFLIINDLSWVVFVMDSHCSPPRQNSRNCWTENSAPRWKTIVPAVLATCKQPYRRYCLFYTRVQPHVVDQSLDALANLLATWLSWPNFFYGFINQLNHQSTPLLRLRANTLLHVSGLILRLIQCHVWFFLMWTKKKEEREKKVVVSRNNELMS
jgi:hypothetical protein